MPTCISYLRADPHQDPQPAWDTLCTYFDSVLLPLGFSEGHDFQDECRFYQGPLFFKRPQAQRAFATLQPGDCLLTTFHSLRNARDLHNLSQACLHRKCPLHVVGFPVPELHSPTAQLCLQAALNSLSNRRNLILDIQQAKRLAGLPFRRAFYGYRTTGPPGHKRFIPFPAQRTTGRLALAMHDLGLSYHHISRTLTSPLTQLPLSRPTARRYINHELQLLAQTKITQTQP